MICNRLWFRILIFFYFFIFGALPLFEQIRF